MRLISVKLPDDHNIFLFGDKHAGSVLSSDSGWEKLCHMMNSKYDGCKNNYGGEGGDDIEGILIDDKKRFNIQMMKEPLPQEQIKLAVAQRQPIKKMLLWKLQGNHEEGLRKFGDLMSDICGDLGVTYGTFSAKITIRDKKDNIMYKIYDTHGRKGISSAADDPLRRGTNQELTLKRHLKFKAGDCAVMIKHHTHKLIVSKPKSELYLTDDGTRINQNYTGWGQTEPFIHPDFRWYGNAGSFLKLFGDGISGYGELAEYDPVELGFLVLKVRDKKIVGLDPIYLNI